MIPEAPTVVIGEIVDIEPLCDEEAFEHECWRLYEGAVAAVGHDPTQVSDLLWRIASNPFSSTSHIPPPYTPKGSAAKPTPALLANMQRRPIT